MLLEIFYVAHFIQNFKHALKCVNGIPFNTQSYYVTALETEVATTDLLLF